MALPADYISGTITLTNGSPDFTGTGTGWQAADFREGDILLGVEDHAGQVYVIEAITGNAAGTLTQAWAGSSGTYTYRMRYEWDSSRVSAQARAMVELLGNGNLEAEAAIDGTGGNWLSYFTGVGAKARTAFGAAARSLVGLPAAANKVPYYTDANTAALTDLTAKARAILSKANNADVLGEIGAQAALGFTPANKAGDTFTGPVMIQNGAAPAHTVSRTGSALNSETAYQTTGGTIYVGNVDGSTFGVNGSPDLSAAWLKVSSALASISVDFEIGAFSATGAGNGKRINTVSNLGLLDSSRNTTAGGSTHQRFMNPSGTVGSIQTGGTATQYNTTSDETFKNFIEEYDPEMAIAIIRSDPVWFFEWKTDGSRAVGWGAQTSYAVSPDLASPGGWFDPATGEPWEEGGIRWEDPITKQSWVENGVRWIDPLTGADWQEDGVRWVDPTDSSIDMPSAALFELEDGSWVLPVEIRPVRVDAVEISAEYMPWGIDQSKRTPYLWAALSWALDKIDAMEARLAALEPS